MRRRLRLVAGFTLFFVVAGAAVVISPRWVVSRLSWLAADPVRFVVGLLVLTLVRPLLAWPTMLLAVVVGYAWGLAGLPVAVALVTLTSVPPYVVARRSADGGRVSRMGEQAVDVAGDFRSVAASRLFPAPSDLVSIAAGVSGVRSRGFVAGTAVGELPWAFAGVVAGRSIETVLEEGLGAVVDPMLVLAALVAGCLLVARPVYRHLRERRPATGAR